MKKKIYLFCANLFYFIVMAQYGNDNLQIQGNNIISIGKKSVKEKHVDGSKYYNGDTYEKVSIDGYSSNVQKLRYDAWNDEMEYNIDNTVYLIDKIPNQIISFVELDKIYICLEYQCQGKKYLGYLVKLVDSKNKYFLYKKERIEKLEGEKSLNGIVGERNDYYIKDKDLYLVSKDNNQLLKFPKNVNDAAAFFGIDKKTLDSFVKTNKISFNKEQDIIKMVEFVNQQ